MTVGKVNRSTPPTALFRFLTRRGPEVGSTFDRALYMPALVATQYDSYLRGFYQRLCRNGKAPLQALAAVMRKLLHAFHAMLRLDQPYDGARLCPAFDATEA